MKAYKCGIFKMKTVVIYINLWYFECDNNQIQTTMYFDVFLIDSMNIGRKVELFALSLSFSLQDENHKKKKK